jgi:multiple sugar transport system substrate-binding protein
MKRSAVARTALVAIIAVIVVAAAVGAYFTLVPTTRQVTVRMLVMSGPEADYVKSVAEVYNEKVRPETGITLVVEDLGRAAYFEKIKTALLAKSPEFDIAWLINTDLAPYAKAGVIEPLDQYLQDPDLYPYDIGNFLPIALEGVKYEGKIYAIPLWISTMFLYYRTDLVSPDEIDTWPEFLETAKRFTKAHNPDSPTEYGTTLFGQKFVTLPME